MAEPESVPERTAAVVRMVTEYCDERGYGPSFRELGELLGMSSPNTVVHHVMRAVDAGLLTHDGNQSRSLRPVRPRCSHGRP